MWEVFVLVYCGLDNLLSICFVCSLVRGSRRGWGRFR